MTEYQKSYIINLFHEIDPFDESLKYIRTEALKDSFFDFSAEMSEVVYYVPHMNAQDAKMIILFCACVHNMMCYSYLCEWRRVKHTGIERFIQSSLRRLASESFQSESRGDVYTKQLIDEIESDNDFKKRGFTDLINKMFDDFEYMSSQNLTMFGERLNLSERMN